MLALIKPENLLLTDSKRSLYFDHWIKILSKVCNTQFGFYFAFAMKKKIGIDPVIHTSLICI